MPDRQRGAPSILTYQPDHSHQAGEVEEGRADCLGRHPDPLELGRQSDLDDAFQTVEQDSGDKRKRRREPRQYRDEDKADGEQRERRPHRQQRGAGKNRKRDSRA